MAAKTMEWRPGPTVCRCCLAEGCYKDISTEYFWMGKREVYSEMLSETFSVSIAYSTAGGPNSNSRLICEPCISRLRDASDFKRQVQECERTFMQHLDPGSTSTAGCELTVEPEDVKIETVKLEAHLSDVDVDDGPDFGDDDDDDLDDEPLTKFATKVPKKESVDLLDLIDNSKAAEKRKSTTKVKATPAKKTKKETVKPTSSKPKPEKKKKEPDGQMAKRNAEVILQYSTVYPFRLRGKWMQCVYCCDRYEDPTVYRNHMDEHHQKFTVSTAFAHFGKRKDYLKVDCTNLKCRMCRQPFETLEDVAKHIYERHECKKLNLNYELGMQPYKISKDNWICLLCDKKFAALTKLCRHTTSHFLKFTCDVCGRCYLTNEALKYHIKCSHSGKYQCRRCWREFESTEEKREHQRNSKPCWTFCCTTCGERFNSWELKQKHSVEIHNLPKQTYNCPDCGEVYDSRKLFYAHYKLTHTDESYMCSYCGLKFICKNALEDHRICHTGEKPFKCTVCTKSFSREKGLKQHMWIHSDIKRFICAICSKQFAQKVSLKCHMKSHHPDITRY
ncbi:oocyte zinc finger protein XlCOF6-like isoform X13 [Achroia grisella]|uniref:oocyte zinc finger protein XlCOF6-like isoform X13 n=1 Tax=Achroia grisella TaxID=688607 RepID=UPI0027D31A9B|nr:oocyte zinc finger protein XlCOF6-like isoform X13 [Achroia grisella]